jgi:hypothetical protein
MTWHDSFQYNFLTALKFRIGFGTLLLACLIKRLQTKQAQFCFRYKAGSLPWCLDLSSDYNIWTLYLEGRKFTWLEVKGRCTAGCVSVRDYTGRRGLTRCSTNSNILISLLLFLSAMIFLSQRLFSTWKHTLHVLHSYIGDVFFPYKSDCSESNVLQLHDVSFVLYFWTMQHWMTLRHWTFLVCQSYFNSKPINIKIKPQYIFTNITYLQSRRRQSSAFTA